MKYLRILSMLTFSASFLGTSLAFAGIEPSESKENLPSHTTMRLQLPEKQNEAPSQNSQPVSLQSEEKKEEIVPPITTIPEPKIEISPQSSRPVNLQPVQKEEEKIPQQAKSQQPVVVLGYTEKQIKHNLKTETERGAESVKNLFKHGKWKSDKKLKKLKLGEKSKKDKKHK